MRLKQESKTGVGRLESRTKYRIRQLMFRRPGFWVSLALIVSAIGWVAADAWYPGAAVTPPQLNLSEIRQDLAATSSINAPGLAENIMNRLNATAAQLDQARRSSGSAIGALSSGPLFGVPAFEGARQAAAQQVQDTTAQISAVEESLSALRADVSALLAALVQVNGRVQEAEKKLDAEVARFNSALAQQAQNSGGGAKDVLPYLTVLIGVINLGFTWRKAQKESQDARSKESDRPLFRVHDSRADERREVLASFGTGSDVVRVTHVAMVTFINDPASPGDSGAAADLVATVQFTGERGHRVEVTPGYWEQGRGGVARVDVPIGTTVRLLLAKKSDRDSSFFGARGTPTGGCDLSEPLVEDVYRVEVRLRAARVDQTFAFRLRNDGNGRPLEIAPL